jgi:hypothetical protein
MTRRLLIGAILGWYACLAGTRDSRGAELAPADAGWPAPIAQDLQRIQRELGGSVVEQFPSLRGVRPQSARLLSSTSPHREAVGALREAASQLDMTANRLEGLELYRQADALREQAQRLRLDARGMIEGPRAMPMVEPSRPTLHQEGERARPLEDSPRGPEIRRERVEPDLQPVPMPDR